jgi:hypothetical protein
VFRRKRRPPNENIFVRGSSTTVIFLEVVGEEDYLAADSAALSGVAKTPEMRRPFKLAILVMRFNTRLP